jgi:hypothetical protein
MENGFRMIIEVPNRVPSRSIHRLYHMVNISVVLASNELADHV